MFSSGKAMATLPECDSPLKLSSTTQWHPYIYQNDKGESTGLDVELLIIILKRMGCELEVIHFPERRALYELSQGHFDIGVGASKNANRLKKFLYSLPYRHESNKFAFRADDQDVAISSSLKELLDMNKVIAINDAGWYGEEIEQAKKNYPHFSHSPTLVRRLKMLTANRVDIVVEDEIVLCTELLLPTYNNINIHPIALFETSVHFIFNKNSVSAVFLEQFDKVLNSMREDGSLQKYYQKQLPLQCQQ